MPCDNDEGTTSSTTNDFWTSLGSPRFVLGPMVDQSELAFRVLCRKYGAELAYTPMLHSRLFVEDERYRLRNFQTCPADRPLVAQFCGDNPVILGQAAVLVAPNVDAVDINFGCPQGIAKRGHYGSFLLDDPDLVESIVAGTVQRSPIPVTCKLRKLHREDLQPTLNLIRRLESVGCAAICLHGRTKEEKGQHCTEADWDVIALIANGGVSRRAEALHCLDVTNADAVMSAEAILEYPALFHDEPVDMDVLVSEYLELAENYNTRESIIKAHLFHSLYAGLKCHTDLRSELGLAKSLEEFKRVAGELRQRRRQNSHHEKFGWYYRYRQLSSSPTTELSEGVETTKRTTEPPRHVQSPSEQNNNPLLFGMEFAAMPQAKRRKEDVFGRCTPSVLSSNSC